MKSIPVSVLLGAILLVVLVFVVKYFITVVKVLLYIFKNHKADLSSIGVDGRLLPLFLLSVILGIIGFGFIISDLIWSHPILLYVGCGSWIAAAVIGERPQLEINRLLTFGIYEVDDPRVQEMRMTMTADFRRIYQTLVISGVVLSLPKSLSESRKTLKHGSKQFRSSFVRAIFPAQTHRRLVAARQRTMLLPGHLQESTDPGKLGRAAFVSVVEPANFGQFYHRTEFGRLNSPRDWSILF